MPRFDDRVAQNVPGRFYVDNSCIYCNPCAESAPSVFREFNRQGWAYVFAQPTTAAELDGAMQAVEGCPTESIGCDGDQYDWAAIPPAKGAII